MASSPSRNLRPEPREPATHDAASNTQGTGNDEQRSSRTAPKGTQRRPSSELPLPAAPPDHFAALRRTRRHRSTACAAMCPQQAPPPPHRPAWRPRDRAAVLAAARTYRYPSVARATSARAEELTLQPALRAGRRGYHPHPSLGRVGAASSSAARAPSIALGHRIPVNLPVNCAATKCIKSTGRRPWRDSTHSTLVQSTV